MDLTRLEKLEWVVVNLEEICKSYFISRAINLESRNLDAGFEVYAPYRHLCNVLVTDFVIRWCKVFGTNSEEMHWKNFVPEADLEAFKASIYASANASPEEFHAYWQQMKAARDTACAHFTYEYVDKEMPLFEIALDSASAAHSYFVDQLIRLGVKRSHFDFKQFGETSSIGFMHKVGKG
ncbi:hypothetical protein CGX12_17970 [Zobellella denitrificans]|uniref:hypothetical protein n=1 Tax=Zobellella denitrificans TaxID=347534 RepID=UPI000B8C3E6B|nr:hypothetical protein [Zobellella denitrificans]OXS13762.1 hypothetical protein CGX12_17970 [Zobellella denitrificans]